VPIYTVPHTLPCGIRLQFLVEYVPILLPRHSTLLPCKQPSTMARTKQIRPMQRIPSGEVMQEPSEEPPRYINGHVREPKFHTVGRARDQPPRPPSRKKDNSIFALLICVGGIYISFLAWAFLQERITKTPYTSVSRSFLTNNKTVEYWSFPLVLNTIQSFFAAISGSCYLFVTSGTINAFPSRAVVWPILLVSITTSLASPFGYASLAYVDYLTYVLAKSCKLLPVMALHIGLFGKRYPLSKYLVVGAVTAGVVIFTLYQPSKKNKSTQALDTKSRFVGLMLLGVNLLFDGITNTVQDHIFASKSKYGDVSGPQLMVASNFMQTALTVASLLVTPLIPIGLLPSFLTTDNTHEAASAYRFLTEHPSVLKDVFGFAVCGAIGQLFIYATLARFDSIVLVTVTVTRKMLTMILSLVWFGKTLSPQQWGGVSLAFGGIAAEGWMNRQEKVRKKMMPHEDRKKEL
jgi:solute carrier family 35 (UDP-galactose transporter), member B1